MTALLSSLLGNISASAAVVVLLSSPSLSASAASASAFSTSPAFFAVSSTRRRAAVPEPFAASPPPSVPFVPARGGGGRGFLSSSAAAAAEAFSCASSSDESSRDVPAASAVFRRRRRTSLAALASATMTTEDGIYTELESGGADTTTIAVPPAASLASSYVVHASSSSEEEGGGSAKDFVFRLYPIDDEGLAGCEGAAAVRALRTPPPPPEDEEEEEEEDGSVSHVLRCRVDVSGGEEEDGAASIVVSVESGSAESDESESGALLVSVLGRVLVQWAAARSSLPRSSSSSSGTTTRVTVSLPDSDAPLELTAEDVLGDRPAALFSGSLLEELSGGDDCEMSEMVDASGSRLGAVPRPLVHKLNLLHRGIGVVVSRDEHIIRGDAKGGGYTPPDVYCHRRTSTKRIFPSMYDMFVGGVSTAGERPALTAAREVAEEYGLTRAVEYLEGGDDGDAEDGGGGDALSAPLFRCTVCTSYNRCVVTVFTYNYRTDLEDVSWQEEEVEWGDFVPYGIVERAARTDVDRLKEEGRWPGTGYGEAPPLGEADGDGVSYGKDDEWREWRFVPDGLLVWEAWVAWRDGSGESKSVQ